jgi:hypothetical protein
MRGPRKLTLIGMKNSSAFNHEIHEAHEILNQKKWSFQKTIPNRAPKAHRRHMTFFVYFVCFVVPDRFGLNYSK